MNKKRAAQVCAKVWVCAALGALVSGIAFADSTNLSYMQGLLPRGDGAIKASGVQLLGDKINTYSGTLEFENTDLSLPGNSALSVAVARRHSAGRSRFVRGEFGDWDLDLPRISGLYATSTGWVTSSGGTNRCSNFSPPPGLVEYASGGSGGPAMAGIAPAHQGDGAATKSPDKLLPSPQPGSGLTPMAFPKPVPVDMAAQDYWQGVQLHIPGVVSEEVLVRDASDTRKPSDGQTYPLITKSGWQLRCLPALDNGAGEGFVALSPDGVQYKFSRLKSRTHLGHRSQGAVLNRQEVRLFASVVTDRFGNTVSYNWDGLNRLASITASDGRSITLGYSGTGARIASASDGTRTFDYGYDADSNLISVRQPDGTSWSYNLSPLVPPEPMALGRDGTCQYPGDYPTQDYTGTATHPSGAVGTFVLRFINHPKADVPEVCSPSMAGARYPQSLTNQTVVSKSLSGPGLAPGLTWQYTWGNSGDPTSAYSSDCPKCKRVVITDPQGHQTRQTYGIRWQVDEGQVLRVDEAWNGSTALRSTDYTYRAPTGMPYPEPAGTSIFEGIDQLSIRHRPQDSRVISQQGASFAWQVAPGASGFDAHVRPLIVTKTGPAGSRTETTSYADNLNLWVLGQVGTVTSNSLVMQENVYSPLAQPITHKAFGVTQSTQTYNPDGTLATKKFGATSNAITYSNYLRGIARNVSYPTGATESAVVNNLGLITSYTDTQGFATGYEYDAMGRLKTIVPPGWAMTTLKFEPVASTEFGLPPGHWRFTVSKGNARTVTYYDVMWRPVMTRTFDAGTEATTRKVTVTSYDKAGKVAFESYPQRDIASVAVSSPGKRSFYDALGRVTRQEADSELGVLTSTTDYLNGFQTRHTDARGKVNTQTFWALESPDQAQLSTISVPVGTGLPAGMNVSISRDAFGKPTSITRGGNGLNVTRSYVYDAGQRLCKTVQPEDGATVQDYDLAGNLAWRAPGQNLPSTSSCDQSSVPATGKMAFGYDALNRLTSTTYGDGSPSVTRAYWPDGLLKTVSTGDGSNWDYTYNELRLPTTEKLTYGGQSYDFTWAYLSTGGLNSLTYPGGYLRVSYAPNALGEPTSATNYGAVAVNAVSFHPNGAVAGYTLGNGVVHSLTQNTRGLPLLNSDGSVLKDEYAYDANGNVASITDKVDGSFSRTMGYDDLDRLISANAPGVWGNASYSYDAVDNLTSATVGSRSSVMNHDASNKLSSIVTNGATTSYLYDANGNVTAKGGQSFSFDLGNRLKSSSLGGGYVYDGLGRRIKVVSTDGSTRIQVYSQAGQLLWATSTGGGSPDSKTAYIYLGGKQVAESVIGPNGPTVTQYVHTDALGSPVGHTNSSGALLNSRTRFEPYGFVAAGTKPGKTTSLIGFTGHVQDAETDLVYMQQRYYDPIAGRFLSVDPVVSDTQTGDHFGRYHYAQNNPYRHTDPDGREAVDAADGDTKRAFGGLPGGPLGSRIDGSPVRFPTPAEARANLREARAEMMKANAEQGRGGEAVTRDKLGDKVAGEQVTFKTSDGTRTRVDFVTTNKGSVETKTGDAQLSPGQAKFKADVDAGRPVTPVGQKAANAGLTPGQPTIITSHTVDRVRGGK